MICILVDEGQYWSDEVNQPKAFEHMEATTLNQTEYQENELIERTILVKSVSLFEL